MIKQPKVSNNPNKKKHVKFSDRIKIKYLLGDNCASRQARDGFCFIQAAADRERFRKRIRDASNVLTPMLLKQIKCNNNNNNEQ